MITWHSVTKSEFEAAPDSDKFSDSLYFITDTNEIYKGAQLFASGVEYCTQFPSSPAEGRLYINSGTYEGKIYINSEWITIIQPVQVTVDVLNTTKPVSGFAVITYTEDYVETAINNAFNNKFVFSTTDLEEGVSTLESGKLYFVYE